MSNARASEAPSQGGNGDFVYAFNNFQYVDIFNFWGGSSAEGNDTPDAPTSGSEGNSAQSGANLLPVVAGVAALAGVGGAAYYFTRKRK